MHKIAKSTLFLPLIVAHLCLNIFGLSCSEETKKTLDSVTPYVEYLRYCGTIRAYRGNYTITEANASWGKWIKGPDNVDEINAPVNQKITQGSEFQFCTAGRSNTPSGTTAYIVVMDNYVLSPIRIYWDVPFIGSFQQNVTFDSNVYYVTTYNLPSQEYLFYQHDIFRKF